MASAIEDSYRGYTLKVYAELHGRTMNVVRSSYELDGIEAEVAPLDLSQLEPGINPISEQFEALKDLIDDHHP